MLHLDNPISKENKKQLANEAVQNPQKIKEYIQLLSSPNKRIVQNIAWIINDIIETKVSLISPYVSNFIALIEKYPDNYTIIRNAFRAIYLLPTPEENHSKIITLSFKYLQSSSSPIAVKAFTMKSLYKMALIYPELKSELYESIQIQYQEGSSGFKSLGGKILHAFDKNIEIKKL